MKKLFLSVVAAALLWGCEANGDEQNRPIELQVEFSAENVYELTVGEQRLLNFAVMGNELADLRVEVRVDAASEWQIAAAGALKEGTFVGRIDVTAPALPSEVEALLVVIDRNGKEWGAAIPTLKASSQPFDGVDLSAKGTANCYVVPMAGKYAFRANVCGNGSGEETKITLTEGMKADWLWQTNSLEEKISAISLDLAAQRIYFTAADAARGNGVLALFDADNKIVWSWHLWFAETPLEVTYANGRTLLDRSIGAVGAAAGSTEAYGLYYQWGRKDPFCGGTATETSATAFAQAVANSKINPLYADAHSWKQLSGAEFSTVEYALSHPLSFISNRSTTDYYDWLAKGRADLWSTQKTIYDPCPVGYKVPDADAWSDFADAEDRYIDGVTEWDGVKYGVMYTFGSVSDWYPVQGYRNRDKGNIVGLATTRTGHYWSNKRVGNTITYFYISKKLSTGKLIQPQSTNKCDAAYGYNVRCCKE